MRNASPSTSSPKTRNGPSATSYALAYSGVGAVASCRTVAQGDRWQNPLYAAIAGAVKDDIIAKLPERETAPLRPMPCLVPFCRAVTAADLADRLNIPPEQQWDTIQAMLASLWPGWHCSRLPDARGVSLNGRLAISVIDSPETDGPIHKRIPRTLLQACALAGVHAGETDAELADERQLIPPQRSLCATSPYPAGYSRTGLLKRDRRPVRHGSRIPEMD